MYNKARKAWESGAYDEGRLLWCREAANEKDPEALFILADAALGKGDRGKETAEAVYRMETAAKAGYAPAALAMGQMFQHGWAVHRSDRTARTWYEQATVLGSREAAELLDQLKKARRRRALMGCFATAAVAALACAVLFLRPQAAPDGILVHRDTELLTPATPEAFNQALQDLVARYDDELVVSGQRSTNRLLLKFEGSGLDLSDFPAATVIADQDNYVIIQFETEEGAQACLDALRETVGILFADMDEYNFTADSPSGAFTTQGTPYLSPYSGILYYTWGVEFLGLDQLAAWLMEQSTTPVTVAVLDTGVEPCEENAHRILEGADMISTGENGWDDQQGHGTHVAGTIIDATWDLDVSILPVKVFGGNQTSDSSLIQGIRYALDQGADVINMSLGGPCDHTESGQECGGPLDYFIQRAVDQGATVVVSAGNGDDNGNPIDTAVRCPAHIEDCVVVAACDTYGALGAFSNYGVSVDVTAPGVDIISYYPGGTFQSMSGTSMAAPHISALAAMLKLYLPDRTPAQIEKYIKDYCVNMGDPQGYGEGIPWTAYFAGE